MELNNYNLWHSLSTGNSYFQGDADCSICGNQIEEMMLLEVWWGKRKHGMDYYCMSCIPKIQKKEFSVVCEKRHCIVLESGVEPEELLPSDATPIFIKPPQLSNKKDSFVWQIGEIMQNSEAEVIDNTRLAGRPNASFAISADEKRTELPISEFHADLPIPEETSPFLLADQQRVEEIETKAAKKGLIFKKRVTEKLKQPKALDEEEINEFFQKEKESELLLPDGTVAPKQIENEKST